MRAVPGSDEPQHVEAKAINKRKINWGILRSQDYISGSASRTADREHPNVRYTCYILLVYAAEVRLRVL